MCLLADRRGQATVEAAFAIPIAFTLVLMAVQPGIVLYDRMVMRHAAAQGCRVLATQCAASGFGQDSCADLVKRQLSAVPEHDLFHVHEPSCTWEIELEGTEESAFVSVTIVNRLKLLPLIDVGGVLAGVADADGCISVRVTESSPTQHPWVAQADAGLSPRSWVSAREGS